ncbi:MAG: hypothetical protein IKG44_01070 [Mogibacterium sp.]|nr:hypothetical protein [Mogibacterium sp.]
MKKALSVLLIAAACFGFYGSAVTVNDVLACKDYWEEAGEKSTADMNKLEDGLNQLLENEQAYLDGLGQIADAEVQLAEGEKTLAKGEADYAAAPGKLAAARSAIASGEAQLADGKETLAAGKSMLKQLKEGVAELKEKYPTWRHGNDVVHGRNISTDPEQGALEMGLYAFANGRASEQYPTMFKDGSINAGIVEASIEATKNNATLIGGINSLLPALVQKGQSDYANGKWEEAHPGETPNPKTPEWQQYFAGSESTVKAAIKSKYGALEVDSSNVREVNDKLVADNDVMTMLKNGTEDQKALATGMSNAHSAFSALDNLAALAAGKEEIQNKLIPLLKKVKGNKDVEKIIGNVDNVIAGLNADDDKFMATMDKIMEAAPQLISEVTKAVKKGEKDLAAGTKKLNAGKAQYRQGLADYKAAPGKLADGRQQLEDGRKQLADGKAQLAQYEDGEQQIRDGLATLFNTEADLDLVSIADRLNGDGDFDNGDNHLEIEEGLNAVEVGRGYQAEDGDLITAEIMGRAVATGGLLAAGVLAVLAAILSFLKKNKAAGVFALLAAAAGAFGAFFGPAQGTYFSEIAGSTIGTLTWVAAGVLGAVALVHAIVHFAAPKNA